MVFVAGYAATSGNALRVLEQRQAQPFGLMLMTLLQTIGTRMKKRIDVGPVGQHSLLSLRMIAWMRFQSNG
jgi:hypothetical protein